MQTRELMDQAKMILTTYACRDLGGEERREMARMVDRFFSDRVNGLDKSAIMENMATPMQALAWFNTYLCETFWKRCCAGPMPDTCEMA